MENSSGDPFLGRIRVGGADAEAFLQGQLTQDLRRLDAGQPVLAGYCSPKGRLLALITLYREAEHIDLELHHSVLDATLRRLRLFVLRSRVTLDAVGVVAGLDEAAWRRRNILNGVPVVYPATSDHFVPQMVNLDQLGGISFSKGCYTGQEIVARLHYLGQLKRRMFLLRGALPAAAPGTPIFGEGESQAVGEVVDSIADAGGVLTSAVLQLSQTPFERLRIGRSDAPLQPAASAYTYDSKAAD